MTTIDRRKQTIRLEVEGTLVRFNSRLTVRRSAIVVAKPAALGPVLQSGSFVRFKLPENQRREVRMEVVTPHFTLTNKQPVFLCRPPTSFGEPSQRQSDRFDTSRFSNLLLHLPGHAEPFRILDVCQYGLRIATPFRRPRETLPAGAPIADAVIHMGRHVTVQLAMVTPRTYNGNSVGMSVAVDPNGDHRKLLMHLLHTLDIQQRETLQAEAL